MMQIDPRVEQRGLWWSFHRHLIIEIFEQLGSPSNKGLTEAADRRKFLAKRRDYLASSVSYTEIDLLTEGDRDLPQAVERLHNYPYMVWTSQVQAQTRHHWGWGWDQADHIPVVTLPLDYPHIYMLDLDSRYKDAYERNRWALRLGDEEATD